MKSFMDFVRMSPVERIQYVREYGLSHEQKEELLQMNRVIACLMREDAYWAGQKKVYVHRIRIVKRW
jgi:hypothetical protein